MKPEKVITCIPAFVTHPFIESEIRKGNLPSIPIQNLSITKAIKVIVQAFLMSYRVY